MRTLTSILAVLTALLPGCGSDPATTGDGGQFLLDGAICAVCRMEVTDLSYAAVSRNNLETTTRVYDSVECLIMSLRETDTEHKTRIWLTDYPSKSRLHPSDLMTVVRANYPSPMGKGYAAFRDPALAGKETARRGGTSGRLEDFVDGTVTRSRREQ